MSISIEKILETIKSVKGQKSDGNKIELNDEEKSVMLMLESSGFFDKTFEDSGLLKIKNSSEFICDNISEISRRLGEKKSDIQFCPNCGTSLIPDSVFCFKCGKKIDSKENFIELPNPKRDGKFFELVKIPGFEMASTPVTQEVWTKIMGENPSSFKGEKNPVDQVTWFDAIYFCNKLSDACGYVPCYFFNGSNNVDVWGNDFKNSKTPDGKITCNFHYNGFRLPTVSEWMIAASGRDEFVYAGSDTVDDVAWYRGNSDSTHSVSSKKPNSFGLYDMSGNVYEWCWDSDGDDKCYCGGSWKSRPESCETACVRSFDPAEKLRLVGFRVVRSV